MFGEIVSFDFRLEIIISAGCEGLGDMDMMTTVLIITNSLNITIYVLTTTFSDHSFFPNVMYTKNVLLFEYHYILLLVTHKKWLTIKIKKTKQPTFFLFPLYVKTNI